MTWFDEGSARNAVDVAVLFDSKCPDVIVEIITAGALVSLGRTSDGGALGVTVTMDGKWRREYFREADELLDWLLEAKEAVELVASTAPRKRSRGTRGL